MCVCVRVAALVLYEIPAAICMKAEYCMSMCVCVSECMHVWLWSSRLKHISVGNNCNQVEQSPVTEARAPGPALRRDQSLGCWFEICVAYVLWEFACVRVCAVWELGGEKKNEKTKQAMAHSTCSVLMGRGEGMRFPWWWEWSIDKQRSLNLCFFQADSFLLLSVAAGLF